MVAAIDATPTSITLLDLRTISGAQHKTATETGSSVGCHCVEKVLTSTVLAPAATIVAEPTPPPVTDAIAVQWGRNRAGVTSAHLNVYPLGNDGCVTRTGPLDASTLPWPSTSAQCLT